MFLYACIISFFTGCDCRPQPKLEIDSGCIHYRGSSQGNLVDNPYTKGSPKVLVRCLSGLEKIDCVESIEKAVENNRNV